MPLEGLKMNAAHMTGKDDSALEPQRSNNGLLRIADLPQQGGGAGGILELSINTFDIPAGSHNEVEVHYLNEVRYFAGKRTYETMTLELNRFFEKDAAELMHLWWGQVQNVGGGDIAAREGTGPELEGGIGLARDYKKNGDVVLFGPNGEFVRTYELLGIWPTTMTPNQIDMSSDEPLRLSVTLRVDKFRYLHTAGAS